MRLVVLVTLAACGSDNHDALEHHHQPLPKLTHLTGIERDELRAAIARGQARATLAKATDDQGVAGGIVGSTLHAVIDDFESTGPAPDASVMLPAVHMVENCLASAAVTGHFTLDVDNHGKVTNAVVTGFGAHERCVQDVLAAVQFPDAHADYVVHGKIVYK